METGDRHRVVINRSIHMVAVPRLVVALAVIVAACTGSSTRASAGPQTASEPPATAASARPSSQAAHASPAPTPLPVGPDVPAGSLLHPRDGWALTGQRLLVTADGGSTWRDVTPPGGFATADADRLLGVDFVDAQHGWMAINEAFTSGTDASYGRVDIWRTTDGGRTWAKTQLPRARFAVFGEIMPAVQFDFLDATHGFAFQSGNEAKGKNDSDLFWTADGGATWSLDRPTGDGSQGNEGVIRFSTPTDGVIVDAMRDNGIVVTHDGGRTWNDAALALPPGSGNAQLFFGQPVYFDGRSGLVTVDFQVDTSNVSRVYRTQDAGSSWVSIASLPAGVGTIAFLDQARWIGLAGSEVVRTADGGQTWSSSAAAGLPGGTDSLSMPDPQHGWALVGMNVCLTFKSDCSSRTGLYATTDGGATWIGLSPG